MEITARSFTTNMIPIHELKYLGLSDAWPQSAIPQALNISMWTIPFEVFSYIILTPLLISSSSTIVKIAMTLFGIWLFVNLGTIDENFKYDLIRVLCYYMIGATSYILLTRQDKFSIFAFVFSWITVIIFDFDNSGNFIVNILLFMIVFCIFFFKCIFNNQSNIPDITYGLYLYAWPVTQICTQFTQNINHGFILSIAILISTSTISWYFLEKKIMAIKSNLSKGKNKHV